MSSILRLNWIVLTLIVAIAPLASQAEACQRKGHCGRCSKVLGSCGCAQPFCGACQMAPSACSCGQPVMTAPLIPQSTMIYQQQQVTTLQPVTRTEIRRQAQVIDVPVTTARQVTVDEGSFQTVWVPKMTTRTVHETTVQKQVRYQDVPYQVVQHVPVVQTRVVPRQVMTYAPSYSTASVSSTFAYSTQGIVSQPVLGYSPIGTSTALVPTPEPHGQLASSGHHDHAHDHHHPEHAHVPTPTATAAAPQSSGGSWAKVPSRQQAAEPQVQLQAYQTETTVPVGTNPPVHRPSVITVWNAQGNYSRN